MHCLFCGEELLMAVGGDTARCRPCGKVFENRDGALVPVHDADMAAQGFHGRSGDVGVEVGRHGVFADTSAAERRVRRNIGNWVSRKIFGCLFTIVFIFLLVGVLLTVGIYVWSQRPGAPGLLVPVTPPTSVIAPAPTAATAQPIAAAAPLPEIWDGQSTFRCMAGSHLLRGNTASLKSGAAIEASGNCRLVLDGVSLHAPVGIAASGNAEVEVRGGEIISKDKAVKALGNATVTVSGAKVKGRVVRLGLAKVTGISR